jgi:hypothetical protein
VLADHVEDCMVKCAGMLSLVLLTLAACGGAASESPVLAACQPRTVSFESSPDGSTVVTPVLPDDDEALAVAIADSFCSPEWQIVYPDGTERTETAPTVLPSDDAACIGDRLVEVLGAARAKELGFGVGPWILLVFGGTNNTQERQIERAEAESIVEVFVQCSDQWKLLLILSVTQGADTISDDSAGCVADRLTDDDAQVMLVSEIDRAYDDPSQPEAQPFPESIGPLLDAYDECLSPAELAAVHF